MSLRGAVGDVAIPRIEGKPIEKDLKIQEIATPVCGLVRNDSSFERTINPNLWCLTFKTCGAMIGRTIEKSVAWQGLCSAALAEQDNRVRFPDGTAAVCANGHSKMKVSHWIFLGRQNDRGYFRKARVRRPTQCPFSASCALWEVRLSQKNGCGTHCGAAASLF